MNKRIISLFIFFSILFSSAFCGCSHKTESFESSTWYDSKVCPIHVDDSSSSNILSVMFDGEFYYLIGEFFPQDLTEWCTYVLFKISSDGELINETRIESDFMSYGKKTVVDDKLITVDEENNILTFDAESGALISCEPMNIRSWDAVSCDDGYVILSQNKIFKYSSNGNLLATVDAPEINRYSYNVPFYENGGKYYAITEDDVYYEIDFDRNSCEMKLDAKQVTNITSDYYGEMIFDANGIYSVNLDTMEFVSVTEWNRIDVIPPYKACNLCVNLAPGKGSFAKAYSYMDGDIDLVLFEKIPASSRENMIPIKVGGYAVNDSIPLMWAIYEFNTSQNEYRVYTEDYIDSFAWGTGVEAQAATAELIQYFNEGNAPDIFYGFDFDYGYFFRSGMVMDMLPYIEADDDFNMDSISENIRDIMTENNNCYQMFAGYSMNGAIGLKEFFGDSPDCSIQSLEELSEQTGITSTAGTSSANTADYIIRYSMDRYVKEKNGDHLLSLEELRRVVDFSLEHGVSYMSSAAVLPTSELVAQKQYLIAVSFLSDIYTFSSMETENGTSFSFVGYPGVRGSAQVLSPIGLVAVSSGTEHPDACWDVISRMFDTNIQEIVAANGAVPVNENVLEEYISFAINPESVSQDNVMYGFFNNRTPVDEWIIEDYRDVLSSVDTVITYDWGIYNLICDEINSYDLQGKTPEEIAESLQSRLDLYAAENY